MKRILLLLSLILIIYASYFIPVTEQKTVLIKASFFRVYQQLSGANNWVKWRTDISNAFRADSINFSVKKDTGSFSILYPGMQLKVKPTGNIFDIDEYGSNKNLVYSFTVLPDKVQGKTFIIVNKNLSIINYLYRELRPAISSDTHIDDLKKFMETDSLYYGCNILKINVPGGNLIVMRKAVLSKFKFEEAAKMQQALEQYIKQNNAKQIQPVIAQYVTKEKDSTQVNVGYFIDKEVTSNNNIFFVRMPKTGHLYSVKFRGIFTERQKVYSGIQQYFDDHIYQTAILPFETYLDNKLPSSDTSRINIQVNYSTFN